MKFHTLKLATLAAMLPLAANAGVTITPMVTYQSFDNIGEDTAIAQLGLGYRFDGTPFAAELVLGAGSFDIVRSANNRFANGGATGSLADTDVMQYRIDGKYYLPQMSDVPLELYAAAGLGQIMLDGAEAGSLEDSLDKEGDYMTYNIGGGAAYSFTPNLKAVGDARYLNWSMGDGMGGDNNVDDYQLSLGLQYDFGGAAPAPVVVEVPVSEPVQCIDADADGVCDNVDKCPGTPNNFKVDASGCPIEIVKPVSIPLRVLFDTNKSVVKPEYTGEIQKVSQFMTQFPNSTTVVEGHTDSRGSAQYNQRLSQRRADSVKAAIVNQGINPARLQSVGYGETKPAASNDTAEGRQQNRRVVAVVSGKQETVVTK